MPTPRPLASVRLSTSPAWTRTSRLREPSLQASASVAPAEVAASTARRAASSSSPVMKRVAPLGAPSHRRSYGGAPDGHPLDPDVALPGADRGRLPRLAAEAGLHLEVVRDRVDPVERLEAVADQGRAPARLGHLPPLDQIALRDAEDEVAGRGLDLAAAERDRVEALLDLGDQLLRVSVARLDVGVGHPRDREVPEGRPSSVAGRVHAVSPGPQPVVEVGGEAALLDHRRFAAGSALVVDRAGPPLAGHAAVVIGGEQRLGNLLTHLAGVDAGALLHRIGLEAVSRHLVEEHAAEA